MRLLNYSNGKLFDKPIVLSENGSDDIILPIGECKKGSLILIHNHPNSTAFSYADFVTLNDNPEIRTIIAVGHNGTVYQMSVGNGKRLDITSEEAYNFYNRAWGRLYSMENGDLDAVIEFTKKLGWSFKYE